jgi:hypothetical protein
MTLCESVKKLMNDGWLIDHPRAQATYILGDVLVLGGPSVSDDYILLDFRTSPRHD